MTLKTELIALLFVTLIAGCEAAGTTPDPSSDSGANPTTAGKTIVGDARMASFAAPRDCEKISLDALRAGGSKRVRSGCVVQLDNALVVVGLNEITTPFDEAFSVSGGTTGDFRTVAAAFPREMLGEYVEKTERSALASGEPGWRYANKRSNLMPGNGGVEGASACIQFSFNGLSTTGTSRRSTVSGLRCARFGESADTIQEVLLEVMTFYPSGQTAPQRFSTISDRATQSLRYE